MMIAIDYDDTYTADKALWDLFIRLAKQRGHKIICATKRKPESGTPGLNLPTVYSYGKIKAEAVKDAGYNVDIWIDDDPLRIYQEYGDYVAG